MVRAEHASSRHALLEGKLSRVIVVSAERWTTESGVSARIRLWSRQTRLSEYQVHSAHRQSPQETRIEEDMEGFILCVWESVWMPPHTVRVWCQTSISSNNNNKYSIRFCRIIFGHFSTHKIHRDRKVFKVWSWLDPSYYPVYYLTMK